MGAKALQNPDINSSHEPDRAAALRRPRAKGAVFRNDVMEEFDASLRKAGPELRLGRGRRNAPSLPFEWFMVSGDPFPR
ncbi:MAG TPA: hypothetical protein PLX89_17200, partial [Verrucomicrobiota bacterium]|nr:hypothetical protein [Verrucomicrobiota bacterium]